MCFFFFKQKTAYEMRISDWSSDVCSSDLFADLKRRVNIEESRRQRDAECIADCRNENISLPDCPYGVIVADRITRVISEQAGTLNLAKRIAEFLRDVSAKAKMLTKGHNQYPCGFGVGGGFSTLGQT